MANSNNYCVFADPPPTYSPVALIGNVPSIKNSDSPGHSTSCGIEMMAFEKEVSSAVAVSRMSQSQTRGPVSLLYNLLNVRSLPSTGLSATLDETTDGFTNVIECRNRSGSVGSSICIKVADISRTSSGGSLASSSGNKDQDASWNQSEELVEAARTRLVHLSTNPDAASSIIMDFDNRCHSQPGTPPSPAPHYLEQRRKYSVGSRLTQLNKQQSLSDTYVPVDLSCKRSRYCSSEKRLDCGLLSAAADDSKHSILKSVLSVAEPGFRRNTVSVCSPRGLLTARRRHVTLAKKAFFPVSARIAEQLKRVIKFANSLPEFCSLPVSDQIALLTSACPRLLLLYMAEVNLQFAVTSVHENGLSSAMLNDSCEHVPSPSESELLSSNEWPTMQFVENTQSFIRKCQSLQIQQNEYFYMRMITLFHTGLQLLQLMKLKMSSKF